MSEVDGWPLSHRDLSFFFGGGGGGFFFYGLLDLQFHDMRSTITLQRMRSVAIYFSLYWLDLRFSYDYVSTSLVALVG